jgi:hypothetical protein
MCSPRVFSIGPHFYPICFAQSPPPSRLYRWAKGGGTPSLRRNFYFGDPPYSQPFLAMGQSIGSLQKNKVGLVMHLPLIHMNRFIYMMNMYKALILDINYLVEKGRCSMGKTRASWYDTISWFLFANKSKKSLNCAMLVPKSSWHNDEFLFLGGQNFGCRTQQFMIGHAAHILPFLQLLCGMYNK